jgi:hypothetical protein
MSPRKRSDVYTVSDKVFAKVRGYSAWPARIEAVVRDTKTAKYKVFFFGTNQSATVKEEELFPSNAESKNRFGENVEDGCKMWII